MKNVFIIAAIILSAVCSAQAIQTEEFSYPAGDKEMQGYLAYPDNVSARVPGILIVHEWWGHNEYARKRARMLAEDGYAALAIDMYGDGKTAGHPKDAGAFSSEVMENLPEARMRFEAGMKALKSQNMCDPEKIAAIGYCFGGGVVLHMARMGVDLDAVVSVHGSLKGKIAAEKGGVKARILVCHGADDQFIPSEDIEGFHDEMDAAEVDVTFKSYAGATHSFSNPDADAMAKKFGLPIGYSAEADEASWRDIRNFLERSFEPTED